MTRKLNEHVEEELHNKEKKVKLNEGVEPKIKKVAPKPPQSDKEGEQPVKKKKPYYKKNFNKPTSIEIVTPEPVNTKKYFIQGVITGVIGTSIIGLLIWFFN